MDAGELVGLDVLEGREQGRMPPGRKFRMVGIDAPRCCRVEPKHGAGVVRQGEPTRFQVELGGGPARVNAPIPDEAGNAGVLGLGLGFGVGAECAPGCLAPTLLLEILARPPFRQPEQAGDMVLAGPPVVASEAMDDRLVGAETVAAAQLLLVEALGCSGLDRRRVPAVDPAESLVQVELREHLATVALT